MESLRPQALLGPMESLRPQALLGLMESLRPLGAEVRDVKLYQCKRPLGGRSRVRWIRPAIDFALADDRAHMSPLTARLTLYAPGMYISLL